MTEDKDKREWWLKDGCPFLPLVTDFFVFSNPDDYAREYLMLDYEDFAHIKEQCWAIREGFDDQ